MARSSADNCAKTLYLFVYSGRTGKDVRFLDSLGFVDWIDGQYPDTDSPHEIAWSAFAYTILACDGEGFMIVFAGLMAFMKSRGYSVRPTEIVELRRIIESKPIDVEQAERAFRAAFYH